MPSRSRLERWKPDSLTFTGQAITKAGRAVNNAVSRISTNIKTMPDTRAWSGDAHSAATSMFERAERQTNAFSEYTAAVGAALTAGAGTIGGARTPLLNKADQLDMGGQLSVSDQWVVMIAGAQLTTQQAAALQTRAEAEQATINGLLIAVGAADDDTATSVMDAATPHGFEAPSQSELGSLLLPGMQKPDDEVPDPANTLGLLQQAAQREANMALTVRDITEDTLYDPVTGEETATVTTYYKQDGSKHVKTVNAKSEWSDRGPETIEKHLDKNGDLISEATSVHFNESDISSLSNSKVTTTKLADGTVATLIEYPDGSRS
ncbi:MAG: hypothetical protein K0U84_23710, partial [Actinomycetia bacterium]|nr:hypothetical protein [Actinomycetes bacterium]